jgi:hypothetical protein
MRDPRLDLGFRGVRGSSPAEDTTVRIVRVRAKIHFRRRLRGSAFADGSQQCERQRRRQGSPPSAPTLCGLKRLA